MLNLPQLKLSMLHLNTADRPTTGSHELLVTPLACKLKRGLLESVLGTGPSARRIRPGSRARGLEGQKENRSTSITSTAYSCTTPLSPNPAYTLTRSIAVQHP